MGNLFVEFADTIVVDGIEGTTECIFIELLRGNIIAQKMSYRFFSKKRGVR